MTVRINLTAVRQTIEHGHHLTNDEARALYWLATGEHVPRNASCPQCNGEGVTHYVSCDLCGGAGFIPQSPKVYEIVRSAANS